MVFLIFIVSLLVAIAIGIPIAFALLSSSLVMMLYMGMFDSQIIAQHLINGSDNFSLLAVPFFILAGGLMNAGGLSKRLIDFAMALLGHVRGGLGFVVILAGVLFAGLSGSSVADTAALGAILIPMMVQQGYSRERATGLVAASGIIAPIIPPSIALILFGVIGGVSITQLFMAGIVPGILMGIGLAVTWWMVAGKDQIKTLPRKSLKEVLVATRKAMWALSMPIIIIGGLRGGFFTATEASAVATFVAFFVGFFIYRELKIRDLYQVLLTAAKTTSVIMFLASAAMVTAWLITAANIPQILTGYLEPLADNRIIILLAIIILIFLAGMVMDMVPLILILTPILMPIITLAEINPVYFGIIFVYVNALGLLTPPVGAVLNVASSVGKVDFERVVVGVWPFLLSHIIVLLLLIFFPQIITIPADFLNK